MTSRRLLNIRDISIMKRSLLPRLALVGLVGGTLVLGACDSESITFRDRAVTDSTHIFNQIDRLGNPLVSEVTIAKRQHGFYNDGTPATDRANFEAQVKGFITGVAGRTDAYATTVAQALLPDELTVNVGGTPASAGWLGYVLTPGAYGGRKLEDDVVDTGLQAIFGTILLNDATGQANCAANLCSDFVGPANAGPRTTNTFPYLAAPNS